MNPFDARAKAIYSDLPPDQEIYKRPSHVVPIDSQRTLETMQDQLFALKQESDSLPQKIETAKRRLNKAEVTNLTQRQAELSELLFHAETAALQAELAIIDTQLPAMREASKAARVTLEAGEKAVNDAIFALRVAQRRCDLVFFDHHNIQQKRSDLETRIASLHQEQMSALFGPERVAA